LNFSLVSNQKPEQNTAFSAGVGTCGPHEFLIGSGYRTIHGSSYLKTYSDSKLPRMTQFK